MSKNQNSLDDYLKLVYPIKLIKETDDRVFVEIPDLPGCLSQGESVEEAIRNIDEARVLWIETAYTKGSCIPTPSSEKEYSGRILLRMPSYLHKRLAVTAETEGVSLNHYLVSLLSSRQSASEVTALVNECLPSILQNEVSKTIRQVEEFYYRGIQVRGLPKTLQASQNSFCAAV